MAFENDRETTLEAKETQDLISSEKVDGTAVYSTDGDKLGSIHHLMIGKRDGKVRYAVLNLGGLFGGDYHPLPWNQLTYNTDQGGYEVAVTKEQLKNSPSFESGNEPAYNSDYDREIDDYYARGETVG